MLGEKNSFPIVTVIIIIISCQYFICGDISLLITGKGWLYQFELSELKREILDNS